MLLAPAIVVVVEAKNICSVLWAVVASSRVSCCRIYKTPTLAKSNASDVAVNVELELVAEDDADVVVADAVDEAGGQLAVYVFVIVTVVVWGVEDADVDEVTSIVRVVVDDGPAMTVIVATVSSFTAAASTNASDVSVLLRLVLWPSKVTRAFSAEQLKLPALSLDRIVVPSRDIEKLVLDCEMRRGSASPTVTLLILASPAMSAVVQPTSSAVEQSKPVKSLVQMQEHMPSVTTLVPPFLQSIWLWHCCSASAMVLLLTCCLRMTKNSTGIITAATMMIMMMIMSIMKPQNGNPQQRRPFFTGLEVDASISPGGSRGVRLLLLRLKGGHERIELRKP